MVVAPFLYRLQFGGKSHLTDEWTNSLMLHAAAPLAIDPLPYWTALRAWFVSPAARHTPQAFLEFVKLNAVNPETGKYASQAQTIVHVSPVGGGGGTGPQAPQLTVAVSLMTGVSRGRGHIGRIFPPNSTAFALGADGRISIAEQGQIAEAARTMIAAVNAVGAPKVVIFSKVAQTVTPVTAVAVGRVIDTQRRRRSSLAEERVVVPL